MPVKARLLPYPLRVMFAGCIQGGERLALLGDFLRENEFRCLKQLSEAEDPGKWIGANQVPEVDLEFIRKLILL